MTLPGGRRRSFYGRTQRGAQAKLLAAGPATADGLPTDTPARLSVGQFLDR